MECKKSLWGVKTVYHNLSAQTALLLQRSKLLLKIIFKKILDHTASIFEILVENNLVDKMRTNRGNKEMP